LIHFRFKPSYCRFNIKLLILTRFLLYYCRFSHKEGGSILGLQKSDME
jgi:hypothetical protein